MPKKKDRSKTNITERHEEVFNALTSGMYRNFALFSCFVNGEPAAAIVAIEDAGDNHHIIPLFVSVTPGMVLADHDNNRPSPEGSTPCQ